MPICTPSDSSAGKPSASASSSSATAFCAAAAAAAEGAAYSERVTLSNTEGAAFEARPASRSTPSMRPASSSTDAMASWSPKGSSPKSNGSNTAVGTMTGGASPMADVRRVHASPVSKRARHSGTRVCRER